MKFIDYNLDKDVLKGLEKMGFRRPTDIQFKTIPSILKGEDVLAIAQTGTGKTAAFATPVIHHIQQLRKNERRRDGIRCIVLVPTHELALQLTEVFNQIARYTKVKILGLIGGVDQQPQIETLEKRVDILIATPGRMFDLISQGYIKVHRVKTLILDEADHMLDLGFIKDINDLSYKLPKKRQTLFFSATINDKIKKLAYSVIKQNAIRIQFSPKDPVNKNINHSVAFIEMDDKRFFLERIINENLEQKILVFVRTKVRAERVAKAMERVNISTITLHADKSQEERNQVLKQFRKGNEKILIATDVTARGIDIPDVDLVINYDLPEKAENYVHRVGRTGRGKKRGEALTFCSEHEKEYLNHIEIFIHKKIPIYGITKNDYKETILLTQDQKDPLGALLSEIEKIEDIKRKKKKQKKK